MTQDIVPCITWDEDNETGKMFNVRVIDTDTRKDLVVIRDGKDCTNEFLVYLAIGKVFENPTFQFKDVE